VTAQRPKLPPIEVAEVPEEVGRTQVAALCWRSVKGKPEVLLVTSRETGRWVLPKGWPVKGRDAAGSARTEAWEEAGVEGKVQDTCVGLYAYHKRLGSDIDVPCIVAVYPIKVKSLADSYPEAGQRRRRWFTPAKAAERVDEPELRTLLRRFHPEAI
jgi:8-oxo-dGTP pyrophosphatase MutT (NUDIX family)